MEAGDPERLRRFLLVLVVLGMLGVGAELILLEHYDEAAQWIPLGGLVAGLLAASAGILRPGRGTVLVLRWVMGACVAAGGLGVYLHVRSNVEFELEMDPGAAGARLFWESMRGATPALAPTALAYLGLLGLLATWRHPALGER